MVYDNDDFGYEIIPAVPVASQSAPKARRDLRGGKALRAVTALLLTVAVGSGCFGIGLSVGRAIAPAGTSVSAAMTVTENSSAPTYLALSGDGAALVSDIYKTVAKSVVSISVKVTVAGWFNQQYETSGAGSGIIFKQDDDKVYILTNYHVINGATSCEVSLDDTTSVSANYVGGSESNDIAVISAPKAEMEKNFKGQYNAAVFADSSKIEVGNFVVAIGNALGEGKSATFGIISAVDKKIKTEDDQLITTIQTDAAINPGNSGGALVDTSGHVIGINTAKLSSVGIEGMGYAIPSNTVAEIADSIVSAGKTSTPYLGVETVTVTEQLKWMYNLPSVGVYINYVQPGSSAADAGLRQGDIITAIDGKTIATSEQLTESVQKSNVGDKLKVSITRGGRQAQEVTVTLKNKGLDF